MATDPDVLHIDRSWRFQRAFVAFPLLHALVFGGLALLLTPKSVNAGDVTAMRAGMLAVSAAGLVVAAGLFWGRQETVIDRRRGVVTRRGGVGRWQWTTTRPLAGVTHAELRVERPHSANHVSYPVVLCGGPEVEVVRPDREAAGRREADRLAAFVGVELRDRSREALGEEAVVRRPADIGVPVGRRVMSGAEAFALPGPPPGMRTTVTPDGPDAFVFTLPKDGWVPYLLVAAMFSTPLLFVALLFVMAMTQAPPQLRHSSAMACMLIPLAAVGLTIAGVVVSFAFARTRVRASPEEVRVWSLLWKAVIPAGDLEEVRVDGDGTDWLLRPCRVMVRSARATAEFGHRLTRAECEYLAAAVKLIVAKGAPPPTRPEGAG